MFSLLFIPSAGGYILDNFPRTREQFTSMIERNIVPDEVIYLKDETENGEFLLKRWYHTNKEGMSSGREDWQTNKHRHLLLQKITLYLTVLYFSFAKSVQCQTNNCMAQRYIYTIIRRANYGRIISSRVSNEIFL